MAYWGTRHKCRWNLVKYVIKGNQVSKRSGLGYGEWTNYIKTERGRINTYASLLLATCTEPCRFYRPRVIYIYIYIWLKAKIPNNSCQIYVNLVKTQIYWIDNVGNINNINRDTYTYIFLYMCDSNCGMSDHSIRHDWDFITSGSGRCCFNGILEWYINMQCNSSKSKVLVGMFMLILEACVIMFYR